MAASAALIATDTLIKPGQVLNPKGRPKGSKGKKILTQRFLEDLASVWESRGMQALEEVATQKPVEFCKIAASLIPKDMLVTVGDSQSFVISSQPAPTIEEWSEQHDIKPRRIIEDKS